MTANVIKKTLPNGLTVLLKEDHTSPIVAVNVWFGVGSVNETEEMNGLAHFQEHMVFKGTKKYGVGEIANIVKSAGGNLNAGTSFSYTMYYIVLPSRKFTTALEVQADAMMNSTFDPDEFQKERAVVIDEARMYDDRPESFTFYRTMELGFNDHTYRRPIAGYEKIVEKITREQLLEFYRNYYRPSNAVLVVVGDVEPGAALDQIGKAYGGWQSGSVTMRQPPAERPQEEIRFKAYTGQMEHGYLGAGFHVPNILHKDYPALEMLSELLSAGKSSRLYRSVLEEKQLVTSVSASMLAEKWPGYFLLMASMAPEKWSPACAAIFHEVERIKDAPPTGEELEKARRQLERDLYRELETMEGQASSLGYYHLLGDYRLGDRHREAVRNVTADEVSAVARRYLHPSNLSMVSYLPGSNGSARLNEAGVRESLSRILTSDGGVTDMSDSPDPESIGRPADTAKSAVAKTVRKRDSGVTGFDLDNGVRVIVKERRAVPVVSILAVFQGGARFEPRGKSGVAMVTHRALVKGTKQFTAEELSTRVEGLGGSIDSFASFDTGGVYLSVLSEHLPAATPLLRDVLRAPLFDAKSVEREKTRLLEELSERHDNPVQRTMDELFASVFGKHPYAHPFLGDPAEVRALTAKDCAQWYRSLLVPANVVVSMVGDIDIDGARAVAFDLCGDLEPGAVRTPEFAAPAVAAQPGEHLLRRRDLKQSVTFVGFVGPRMMTDDAVALQVLNGVLTGLGGRLFVELRDKRSLGYMTGSSFNPLFEQSIFFGYANPTAPGIDEAVRVILHELDLVTREEVSDEELARSREWLIGSQVMQLQRNSSQASAYGTYEALGFGWEVVERAVERVQKVTKADIMRVARAVFQRDKAVVVRMMPEE